MWAIATGTYFAFSGGTEDPVFELRAQIDRQYFDQKQLEQQLTALLQRQKALEKLTSATSDSSATGTIKPERIAPPEATPAEKPTPASPNNDTAIFFGAEREAQQSPELPASTTTKHQIHRAARHSASLRRRVDPPKATPAEQPPQLTSAITKPDTGLVNQ